MVCSHWKMITLQDFCGFSNGTNFVSWNNTDFGHCFEPLCLVCPANFLLACSSIFFASGKRQRFEYLDGRLYLFSKLQALISCLIFLESVIEAVCSWLLKSNHPPVYLLTCSLIAVAWILNAVNVWRNKHVILLRKCYPTFHVAILILVFLVTAIQFYSVTLQICDKGFHSLNVSDYGTICRISLQLIFLILLILPVCVSQNRIGWNVQISSSATVSTGIQGEREALLRSASRGTFYSSTQCVTDDLGVAEDRSNFLSKLTFWWVRPMMKKGYNGNLQSTANLFLLPRSLSTKKLRILFSANFDGLPVQPGTTDKKALEESCSSDSAYSGIKFLPGVQKSVSDENFQTSAAVRRMTSTGSYTSTEFSEKGGTDIPATKVNDQRSLLSALHHSFGVQYYCVGLLKLMGDALSFAGPLLLHALVSFMENKQVN